MSSHRIALLPSLPFFAVHAIALATPFLAPVSLRWAGLAAALYAVRMFGITAGYHRYFSHRAFRTSRAFQLVVEPRGLDPLPAPRCGLGGRARRGPLPRSLASRRARR
jgi:fatty-acid desaturase